MSIRIGTFIYFGVYKDIGMDMSLFNDEVFRFLCRFAVVENFYKRGMKGVHLEGVENEKTVGALIVRDVPGILSHVKQDVIFTPVRGMDLRKKLIEESHLDGAYVLEYNRFSNKLFLQNFVNTVMRYKGIKSIEVLQERCLPKDFLTSGKAVALDNPMMGSKTQVAIAAGLLGGRSYILKQTAYAGLSSGKVCVFDSKGLHKEFFLSPDTQANLHSEDYFDPQRKIIGIVRVYEEDKSVRAEYRVIPSEIGIQPDKFLPKQSFMENVFSRIPIIGNSVTTNILR